MWKAITQFFRENPRAWIVGVAAVAMLGFIGWIMWSGGQAQVGQSSAAQTCAELGGTLCCTEGSICSGTTNNWSCPTGYQDLGASTGCSPCCKATAVVPPEEKSCSELGGNLCSSGGSCPTGYRSLGKSKSCDPCCTNTAAAPNDPSYSIPPIVSSCTQRINTYAEFQSKLSCPDIIADNLYCNDNTGPNWEGCGMFTNGSVAHLLHWGHVNWDRSSNKLYGYDGTGEGTPGTYTDWHWFEVPTTIAQWCTPNSIENGTLKKTTPPSQAPCFPSTARCLDGSAGYYGKGPLAGQVPNYATCRIGTPTSSTVATPVVPTDPVYCTPESQTVSVNELAVLQATGGNGTFQWNITGGGVLEAGGNETVSITYAVSGAKIVRVNSGNQSARCSVTVTGGVTPTVNPSASPTSSPQTSPIVGTTQVSVTKNSSVSLVHAGEVAQFTIRITNIGTNATSGLTVRDIVPSGMTYQNGSTLIDGQQVANDLIVSSGIVLGRLEPADTVTIQWTALADQTNQLAPGPQRFPSGVLVTSDNAPTAQASIFVTVYGTGIASGIYGVETGPGDAITIALIVAAGLTILYTGYTRSASFRRREAVMISKDQGPLNFRN